MGVCTFFDKSMKVLSSILVGMAAAQWEGFNYDDYSDVGKNQASQVNVLDVLAANTGGSGIATGYALPNHYLGNGLKCWFCNSRSVRDCFESNTFTVCQGQEYFCSITSAERSRTSSIVARSTLIISLRARVTRSCHVAPTRPSISMRPTAAWPATSPCHPPWSM